MNKECYECKNLNNCIRYNVYYDSKYCKIHKGGKENESKNEKKES